MRKYYCSYANCKTLIDHRGYCAEHIDKKPRPFDGAVRSSSLYGSSRWATLRNEYITDDSQCSICGSREQLHLDHIAPHRGVIDLFFNEDNLCCLCASCHRIKTAQEIANRSKIIHNV